MCTPFFFFYNLASGFMAIIFSVWGLDLVGGSCVCWLAGFDGLPWFWFWGHGVVHFLRRRGRESGVVLGYDTVRYRVRSL
ncbi:hypothetical protein QBC46DRAFT_371291 [Diplogelasinospora grovesii]|uniref:Uncharacterized protein n=1 Tax=Diplogelasinospora grovesii TaxID=303347 RepID=A0AAN6NH26_9PEZI|nr:hypothetical protein QBC46DRAFT_371291 [Diplogelasinospora grovesii]